MAYLIFTLIKLLEFLLIPVGIPMFFICYPLRRVIDRNPTLFKFLILYWFVNSDEPSYEDNWYGVYEILGGDYEAFNKMNWWQKLWLSFEWVAIRNPHWNLKLLFGRVAKGEIDESTIKQKGELIGEAPNTVWRNKTIFGRQSIRYKVKGGKINAFRYSFTRPIKKYSPFKILGYKYINVMLGYENQKSGRLISKLRVWK